MFVQALVKCLFSTKAESSQKHWRHDVLNEILRRRPALKGMSPPAKTSDSRDCVSLKPEGIRL